jgi:MFS family permease
MSDDAVPWELTAVSTAGGRRAQLQHAAQITARIDRLPACLVPKHMRGRAFALNHFVEFCALPILAFLAWLLVPRSPLGISGWRYVVFLGSAGALFAWWLRRGLPESPRWLAQQGYLPEARRIMVSEPALLVTIGVLITGFSILLSLSFHPYQAELYPTQLRARAVGFVYSFSRISTALTSFLIAFFLQKFGTAGVFGLISGSMLIVVLSIGIFGPRTRGIALEDISH